LAGEGLPADVALTLFGQTILVTLPPQEPLRHEWEGKLSVLCPDYRVDDTRSPANWTLVCIAPNDREAEALDQEVSTYFTFSAWLIPPWSTTRSLTPAQQKARQTYVKLRAAENRLTREPPGKLDEVFSQMNKNKAAWDKFQEELVQSHRESVTKALEEVRREGEPAVDLQMTRLYETWNLPLSQDKRKEPEKIRKVLDEMAERMGALPKQNGKLKPGADHESARFGRVTRTGLLLRFDSLAFHRTGDGLPALAEWLSSRECLSIKYGLRPRPPRRVRVAEPVKSEDDD
jgi:hypothetical protein